MIFISYSHKNGSVAGKVKEKLEEADYPCFLAHDDMEAGDDWHEKIWQALHDCDAFLGLCTDEFNASAFCQQELGAAFALNKARLLAMFSATKPPGFSARFQGVKPKEILNKLDTLPMFQALRISSWISGVAKVGGWVDANALHDRFHGEWDNMTEEEQLRWLVAAASNSEASGYLAREKGLLYTPVKMQHEAHDSAPFFRQAHRELRELLTPQWLFDNDKKGVLHNPAKNPVGRVTKKRKKKK